MSTTPPDPLVWLGQQNGTRPTVPVPSDAPPDPLTWTGGQPDGTPQLPPKPKPAYVQPQGSSLGRAWQGFWANTGQALGATGNAIADVLNVASGQKKQLDPQTAQIWHNMVQAHVDQYNKMVDAWNRGDHVEAAGHAMGMIPMIGPAAAHAGERMSGTDPVFDKYGNVVTPGQAPDIAGGIGEAVGLLGPSLVKAALPASVIARVPGFNRATPEVTSAIKYLTEQGPVEERVPANVAAATSSPYLGDIQKLTGTTPGGAIVSEAADRATAKALAARAAGLEERAAPGVPVTPETQGTALGKGLEANMATHAAEADQNYALFRTAEADPANIKTVQIGTRPALGANGQPLLDAGGNPIEVPVTTDIGLPVDMSGMKQMAQPLFDDLDKTWTVTQKANSPGYVALKNILSDPDYVAASTAEKNLSALKTLARNAPEGSGQGLAKRLIPQLQDAVDQAAAQGGPDVATALQKGRMATAAKYGSKAVLDELRDEPVQAFNQTVMAGDAGIDYLRQVAQELPSEMPKLGRAYLNNMFTKGQQGLKGAAQMYRDWQNMGPSTKQILFGAPLANELDNFFLGAKKLAEVPNPSRTAIVGSTGAGAVWAVTHPVTGIPTVLGTAALAKLFRSPLGVRLFTEGMNVPLGSAQAAARAAQLLQMAGVDQPQQQQAPTAQARGGVVLPPALRRSPSREQVLRSLMP